jgi:hypothetical protein
MPLTGKEKRAYQREYMRKKRQGLTGSNKGLTKITNKSVMMAEAGSRMVGGRGLGPLTSAMSTQCSNQLS